MDIKNLFKKEKPKHNINEDFSKILGFEQKRLLTQKYFRYV